MNTPAPVLADEAQIGIQTRAEETAWTLTGYNS